MYRRITRSLQLITQRAITTARPTISTLPRANRQASLVSINARPIFTMFGGKTPVVQTSKDSKTVKDPDGRIRHTVSRVVPFPASLMCDISADVGKYKEFLPFCERSPVKSTRTFQVTDTQSSPYPLPAHLRTDKLPGTLRQFNADLSIGFKAFTLTYSSTVTVQHPYCVISVAQPDSAKIFDHLISEWRFEDVGNDQCRVEILIDFRVTNMLYATVVNNVFTDIASKQLDAFTQRAQQLLSTYMRSHQNKPSSSSSVHVHQSNQNRTSPTAPPTHTPTLPHTLGGYMYMEHVHWSDADLNAFLTLSRGVLNPPAHTHNTTPVSSTLPSTSTMLLNQDLNDINININKTQFVRLCDKLASTNATNSGVFLFSRYTECFALKAIACHDDVADKVWTAVSVGSSTVTLAQLLKSLYLLTRANCHERIMHVFRASLHAHEASVVVPSLNQSICKATLSAALHTHFSTLISVLDASVHELVLHRVRISQHSNQVVLPAVTIMKTLLAEARVAVDEKCERVCASLPVDPQSPTRVLVSEVDWTSIWSQGNEASLLETLTLTGFNGLVDWSIEQASSLNK